MRTYWTCFGGDDWRKARDARPVAFEGFEEFEFFVSRDTGYSVDTWGVTEASSGCLVIGGLRTDAEAIDLARERLKKHSSPDDLRRRIAERKEKFGAPRVEVPV